MGVVERLSEFFLREIIRVGARAEALSRKIHGVRAGCDRTFKSFHAARRRKQFSNHSINFSLFPASGSREPPP